MCVFSSFLFSSLLYYFLDFWRKKNISSCFFISFLSASIFLLKSYYIFHLFFFLLKNWYQLYITHNMLLFFILLYYYQQEDWTFCFCFFIAKKLEQTDHRYLLILTTYILFHFAGNLAKVEIDKHIFSGQEQNIKNVKPKAVFWLKHFPKY